MFEGKHIHFSPVDNKPLCSFSNKLCRQRRLNGYAFCIRHILEDKSAPFKRCTYVTRNNNQICQNAIPTSQERGYCHSHMQVAGIIPKTERKVKTPSIKGDMTNGIVQNNKAVSNNSNNSSNNNTMKKDPNAVFKFEEEHSEIQWIPKGGSINGIVNGGKSSGISKGKDLQTLLRKEFSANGDIFKGHMTNGTSGKKKPEGKDGKGAENTGVPNAPNGTVSEKGKSRQTYGKKSNGKTSNFNGSSINLNNTQLNSCVRDRWKEKEESTNHHNNSNDKMVSELKSVVVPRSAQRQEKYFEQLKTFITVEKSVLGLEVGEQKSATLNSFSSNNGNAKAVSNLNNSLRPGSLIPSFSNNNVDTNKSKDDSLGGVAVNNSIKNKGSQGIWGTPADLSRRNWETRQEFLARVRKAFKSQYLSIKNSSKESEKNEQGWKKALRNSLIKCVLTDSSRCAHVLVQNDPPKYSDTESNDKISKQIEATSGSSVNKEILAKHNKTVPNGLYATATTKKRKNGECLKSGYGNEKDVSATEIKNSQTNNLKALHLNGLINSNASTKSEMKPSNSSIEKKTKSKDSKLLKGDKNCEIKAVLEIKNKPQPSKRKPRKGTNSSVVEPVNGIPNTTTAAEKNGTSSTATTTSLKSSKDTTTVNDFLNGLNGSTLSKKRKFDVSNGNELSKMDATSTFRVPKLEDSTASGFSSIDVKMEDGHLMINNFNAHLNNHSLFHPNSSSSSNSTIATTQLHLQQILSQPDLRTLASHNNRNQGIDTVLNSVGSSDMGTSDGVITDASFDSTFDHSASSQQDCEFSDDDLEKSLEFQLDPETEHQASRLLEDNELTEDDLNELFPETRLGDNKIGRSDLSDLGIDFTSTFDATDIDYSLFANIFPFTRSNQSESISVTNQF